MRNISVFILDDDVYFGRCMQKKLQKAFSEVRHFKTERNFYKALDSKPDVVILDHHLGKERGLDVLDNLKKRGIDSNILYVSSQENVHVTLSAYQKGVLAYFEKNRSTFQDVLTAIRWMGVITNDFTRPLNKETFRRRILTSV